MLSRRAFWALVCAAAQGASTKVVRPPDPRAVERKVFRLVNNERRRNGLAELVWDDALAAEARRHSYNMIAFWFFAHEDPARGALGRRLREAHIPWRMCAENIFNGHGYPDLAAKCVESWLASPGHRANILNPNLTRTGVGAFPRHDDTLYITQNYIRP